MKIWKLRFTLHPLPLPLSRIRNRNRRPEAHFDFFFSRKPGQDDARAILSENPALRGFFSVSQVEVRP